MCNVCAGSALAFGDVQSNKEIRETSVGYGKVAPPAPKIDFQQTMPLDPLVHEFYTSYKGD